MFSDFKTRGFGLENSHIQRPARMDRLILVMALALFWAVSTGMWDKAHHATPDEKSSSPAAPQSRPQPDLAVQARHPAPADLPAEARPASATLECLAELRGGKEDVQESALRPLDAHYADHRSLLARDPFRRRNASL